MEGRLELLRVPGRRAGQPDPLCGPLLPLPRGTLRSGHDIRAVLSDPAADHCRGIFTDSQFFGTLVSSYADDQGASEGRSNPAAVDRPQV